VHLIGSEIRFSTTPPGHGYSQIHAEMKLKKNTNTKCRKALSLLKSPLNKAKPINQDYKKSKIQSLSLGIRNRIDLKTDMICFNMIIATAQGKGKG